MWSFIEIIVYLRIEGLESALSGRFPRATSQLPREKDRVSSSFFKRESQHRKSFYMVGVYLLLQAFYQKQ
ncbi:hypothetical protein [Salipaludibacillus sp. CF4.18]|uniref:hypothetical protein n=1 Tax=Salipaludibacillus sp. CF4.18 TaxID=3373081 RepID=UPI003EE47A79